MNFLGRFTKWILGNGAYDPECSEAEVTKHKRETRDCFEATGSNFNTMQRAFDGLNGKSKTEATEDSPELLSE